MSTIPPSTYADRLSDTLLRAGFARPIWEVDFAIESAEQMWHNEFGHWPALGHSKTWDWIEFEAIKFLDIDYDAVFPAREAA